jgi:hypothetical protein
MFGWTIAAYNVGDVLCGSLSPKNSPARGLKVCVKPGVKRLSVKGVKLNLLSHFRAENIKTLMLHDLLYALV